MFLVFTSERAMGEYGKESLHIECSFADVIRLAKDSSLIPDVIIVNPFRRAFEVPKEL